MITTVTSLREVEEIVSVTCDVCNTVYGESEIIETQEFSHIGFTGGYGSVFGDGIKVEVDICQTCLHDMISEFCRYPDEGC